MFYTMPGVVNVTPGCDLMFTRQYAEDWFTVFHVNTLSDDDLLKNALKNLSSLHQVIKEKNTTSDVVLKHGRP